MREKELIAVAVAHITGCPYCTDIHTKAAKKAGVTKEELAESILVATALKAGSALAHSVNALNAFDSYNSDTILSNYIVYLSQLEKTLVFTT